MVDKWQPVVGGRCVWVGRVALVVGQLPWGDWAIIVPEGERRVSAGPLAEHPADRWAKQLLEAAREVDQSHKALMESMPGRDERRAVARHHAAHEALRAIMAEHDAEEDNPHG